MTVSVRARWARSVWPYLLLAPAALTVAVVAIVPLLQAVSLSLHDVGLPRFGEDLGPVTFQNYGRLFDDPHFPAALGLSLGFTLAIVVTCLVLGMALALLLDQAFKGRRLARLLVFVPWAIPEVIAVNIWTTLLDASYGPINYLLRVTGLVEGGVNWFVGGTVPAVAAVLMVSVWKSYPFYTVVLLAGLQAVPRELHEAARVDGAGAVGQFRHITLPALRPVIAIAALLGAVWAFRSFTLIWVLTGGGPARATETLAIWTYREAFGNLEMGFASAIGVISLVILLIAGVIFIYQSRSSFYD